MKEINMRDIGKIEISIMKNDMNSLKKLLNEHPECLNYSDSSQGTLLHVASEEGNIEAIKYLLSLGLDINKCAGAFDANPLISAIVAKQCEAEKYLIDSGIELDTSTSLRNPLISAIYNREVECVKLLIEKGIDVNVTYTSQSGEKLNALSHAHTYGNDEIIELIENEVKRTNGSLDVHDDNQDELINYIEDKLGNIDQVITEVFSVDDVNIDINIINPTRDRDYITLVTNGMSYYPMGYSENDDEYKYAELVMKLPSYWKLDEKHCKDDRYGWPLKIMRMMGHLPHRSEGYINESVIIPNGIPGEPPLPYHIDTWLSAIMVCKCEDIPSLKYDKEKRVDFFTLVPICDEEIDEARKIGNDNFMKTLPLKDVVDEERGYED